MSLPFTPPTITCDTCCSTFACPEDEVSGSAYVAVSGVVMPDPDACLGGTSYTANVSFKIPSGTVDGGYDYVPYGNPGAPEYAIASVPYEYYDDNACSEYDFTDTLYMYLSCSTAPNTFTLSIGYPINVGAPRCIADGGSYLFIGTGTYDPATQTTTIVNTCGPGTATITIEPD